MKPASRRITAIGTAVLSVVLAALLRWGMEEAIPAQRTPYLTFNLAIVFAAALGGFWPGIVATILSAICVDILFPYLLGYDLLPGDLVGLIIFLACGTVISLALHALRRSRQRAMGAEAELQEAKAELEDRVLRRTAELDEANRSLREHSRYLEAFFQHALTPFVFLDRRFNFIRVNEAYARGCGKKVSEFPGHNHFEMYPHPGNQAIFEAVVRTKKPFVAIAKPFEFPDHPEWGVTYWDWTLVPSLDASGEVEFLVFALRDVTEQKRAELELREHADRLEEIVRRRTADLEAASAAKDRFLAVLSHELRTPLSPVLLASTILESDPELPPRFREDLGMIRRNVELEARLIDDILDVTRIARGKLPLAKRFVEGAEVLRHALEICQAEAAEKGVELTLEAAAARSRILADPARIQQIFWNLIGNAVKFTPPGGRVAVRCFDREDAARPGTRLLVVEVRDTGVGIPPEVQPRLFHAFEQGGESTTRRFGGLGLGLAISKGLVGLHGGRIAARSEGTGKGATFTVELPLADPEPSGSGSGRLPPGSPARASGSRLRILLVEDHAITASVLARLLGACGYQVRIAGTRAAAISEYEKETFDLIISDLGLPDGNGCDLLKELRALRPIDAIALTGYGMEEDLARTRQAGFGEHLTKPVNAEQLKAAIARITSVRADRRDDSPAPEMHVPRA